LPDRANLEKTELNHEATGYTLDTNASERSVTQANADLTSVTAQITAFTAALEALPDGEEKENMRGKIRRLNDRKDNLNERIAKSGNSGLLLVQLRKGLADAQVAALDAFITGVNARKTAIG
jgi:predicted  nucleic acid-binding Zn-ribbon protein